ncbi:MAG: DUF2116 family Zn-ribbon domain-containing protein [Azoarcus sp.]|nr:DUF2116 family Zn-ribbon domain-containing protein [Azoarcus sp.]
MSDLADIAQNAINAFASSIPRLPDGPAVTGRCHWCGDPLPPGKRWCDSDCRDDWERAQRAQKNHG